MNPDLFDTREAIVELMSEESQLCGEEVTYFEEQQVRLYNLTADPSEKNNIAAGNQGRNSIALLKSQQTFQHTFQQSFYCSVGHPVVLETLLKLLLKSLLRFQQSY